MTPSSVAVGKTSYRTLYLLLSVLGSLLPWAYLLQFFLTSQNPLEDFFQQAFANPVSTALAADLLISSLVFWVFAFQSLPHRPWQRLPYVLLNLAVGLSCAFPLFLVRTQTTENK